MGFVLLSEYKEILEITGNTEDEFVALAQLEIEEKVKSFLGRELEADDYTELLDGDGSHTLIPNNFPINSVALLEFYDGLDSNNDEQWDTQTQGDDYERLMIPTHKESITLSNAFPKGIQNIRVTYNAGYEIIPYDIQQACKKLMLLYYGEVKKNKSLGKSSTSDSANFSKTTTFDLGAEERILKSIEKYRAINV